MSWGDQESSGGYDPGSKSGSTGGFGESQNSAEDSGERFNVSPTTHMSNGRSQKARDALDNEFGEGEVWGGALYSADRAIGLSNAPYDYKNFMNLNVLPDRVYNPLGQVVAKRGPLGGLMTAKAGWQDSKALENGGSAYGISDPRNSYNGLYEGYHKDKAAYSQYDKQERAPKALAQVKEDYPYLDDRMRKDILSGWVNGKLPGYAEDVAPGITDKFNDWMDEFSSFSPSAMGRKTTYQSAIEEGFLPSYSVPVENPYQGGLPGLSMSTSDKAKQAADVVMAGISPFAPKIGETVARASYGVGASPGVSMGLGVGISALTGGVTSGIPGLGAVTGVLGKVSNLQNAGYVGPENRSSTSQRDGTGNPFLDNVNNYWSQYA